MEKITSDGASQWSSGVKKEAAPWEAECLPNSEHFEEAPTNLSGWMESCMKMDNTVFANSSSGSAAMNLAR